MALDRPGDAMPQSHTPGEPAPQRHGRLDAGYRMMAGPYVRSSDSGMANTVSPFQTMTG